MQGSQSDPFGTAELRRRVLDAGRRRPRGAGRWQEWYQEAIPAAEAAYEAYLKEQR